MAFGLGHAVLCAERLVNDCPFAVILADDLLGAEVLVMQQSGGAVCPDSHSIFAHLHSFQPSAGGELQLTDGIAALLKQETVLAYQFEGVRYDCDSKLGYLQAMVQFGLKNPEVKNEFNLFCRSMSEVKPTCCVLINNSRQVNPMMNWTAPNLPTRRLG